MNNADNSTESNICSGDSGGSQMYFDSENQLWIQLAVHSWGDQSCLITSGSTRTDLVVDWIYETIVEVHGSSDICEIKKNNKGNWNTPKIIKNKTINTSYFEGSATLTADGNTMYFVTDRKGEKKSTDIYVVHREGKSWGDAI